jgi:spore maturation protein CgeB
VSQRLRLRIFSHSWISDWNHGNAHFLRGLAHELIRLGHEVRCYEEAHSWSMTNLMKEGPEQGSAAYRNFSMAFPTLGVRFYDNDQSFAHFAEEELRGADVVLVHEWNPPEVVSTILSLKKKLGYRVLFHDTHHRAYTSPQDILRFPLHSFDGVLAFGEAITQIYKQAFGISRVWTFHEAADTSHFRPLPANQDTALVWIGNWGDEERTAELEEFLLGPAEKLRDHTIAVHGVRYPQEARKRLDEAGIEFRGYLPNLEAPKAYARSLLSLHVPRRFYANGLSGIPTIRVFEALACGAVLVCAPWSDTEGLFRAGEDYIVAADGPRMAAQIHDLLRDDSARRQIAAKGRETILNRHTCAHRALQLLEICSELNR